MSAIKNPMLLTLGGYHSKYIVDKTVALKIFDLLAGSPDVLKLETRYADGENIPYCTIPDAENFQINLVTHAYMMWGLQNQKDKEVKDAMEKRNEK
jgi:hypothetical protein